METETNAAHGKDFTCFCTVIIPRTVVAERTRLTQGNGRAVLAGAMSACPAYLGLTIFDAGSAAGDAATVDAAKDQRSSVLFRSDLLIFCPSNFTVSVRLAPLPAASASSDRETLRAIVVRFADSGSSPFCVRLSHVTSNSTGGQSDQQSHAGARRRSSPAPNASQTADRVADFTGGNVLIAIAITGALFIVVYIGQSTARATTHVTGTLISMCYAITER